ncbi:MAG: LuxR C-terminal-related transcriptional regulator [Chloroflexota bacterium]|nr:LuxR C-terminal-related transcriptional regulator [Chloroflexota bacterium]
MAFVGRQRELAVLSAALERAAAGETARVVIGGQMGNGVSRLLDELETRLAGMPDVVLCRGHCYLPTAGTPYAALRDALGRVLAGLPDERLQHIVGDRVPDATLLFAGLAERLAGLEAAGAGPRLDAPDQRGARVVESLLGMLERLADGGVVCLVLEDLEHSDPGTREFVGTLLRLSRRLPLALLLTYHRDEIHRGHAAWDFINGLREHRHVDQLAVGPLGRDELLTLIEDRYGEPPSLSFAAAIIEGSRGNPLLASQLLTAHRELERLRLSDPLPEIIHARLDAVAPPAVRVLRVLAAARRPLSEEELLGIELPDGHLARPALAAAVESGLCVGGPAGLSIVHQLCAEPIEGLMLPIERQRIHEALARRPADPGEQAWHWEQAYQPAEAGRAHLAAARAATAIEPGQTALSHYQRALELSDEVALADGSLLADAAAAAEAAGAFRRAAALVEMAIEKLAGGRAERLLGTTTASADRARRAAVGELFERLGRYQRAAGDPLAARRSLERAIALIPAEPSALRARALASLGQHLMIDGDFERSAEIAERARSAARAAQPPATAELAHATCTLGVDLGFLGRLEAGLAVLEEATELARAAGRLDEMMRSYANRTTLLDRDSRREQALAVVKEGMAEAKRGGLALTYGAFLRGNAADILFQLGRWEESERECRAALEFPPSGVAWFTPVLYLALVLVESRADEEAARIVGQTLLMLETVPAGQWSAIVQRAAVSLALWRGDPNDARQAAAAEWERVVATDDAVHIAASAATILEACAAAAERGRERRDWSAVADSGELAAHVLPVAERHVANSGLPPTLGARREAELYLATARAHQARLRGRPSAEQWAAVADGWRRIPIPYHVAKARWWQAAAALEARASRSEARAALLEAWQISGQLPARPLRRALLQLAGRARIPLPDDETVAAADDRRVAVTVAGSQPIAVGPGPGLRASIAERLSAAPPATTSARFGLSPRENEVLLVLAEGRTNREIAERLFISERTVGVHVRRILAKLGVAGRVEAAGVAIRLGLVPEEPSLSRYLSAAGRR